MNLSEPFIRRPVMTLLLTVTVILFGVMAYMKLPVNDLPTVDYPVIQVNGGVSRGQSADDGGQRRHAAGAGVHADSRHRRDHVQEQPGKRAASCCNSRWTRALTPRPPTCRRPSRRRQGSLPTDLPAPPTFTKTNPNDQPIMYIALTSDSVTKGAVYDFANTQVGQRISIVEGVSRVLVYGAKSAIRIKADPSKMAIRNISIDDLTGAVQEGTSYVGAGQFDGPDKTCFLQPKGQLESAEQYNNLIVNNPAKDGAPVYLKDVATAVDSVQDERINMRFWARGYGTPSATVVVAVFRQAGANAVDVSQVGARSAADHQRRACRRPSRSRRFMTAR